MITRLFIAIWGAASMAAHAQPAPRPPAQSASLAPFQSAFDGYLPYADEPTADWKAANDTTARIGGWRAYAKEANAPAAQPELPSALPPAPPAPTPALAPALNEPRAKP